MQHKKNTIRLWIVLLILWYIPTLCIHIMNCKNKMKWRIVSLQTFQCMCWQSIRNMNTNKGILNVSKHHSWKEKTSIPNVVTEIRIHTANPNCVYCVQSISLAHVQSSGRGAFRTKNERIHIHINSKILLDYYWR